ncbi:MAG: DUF4271 domain-containing protein [Bacteroidales bacterium]|nr:DUF4271 domain-containing protein [Bacteroidales bacterium]
MLFKTLALISLLIALLLLKTMVGVFPSLVACLTRWKESVNLDASVQLSRNRDITTLALVIPFCLTVTRFRLYDPHFMVGLNDNGRLAVTIGILIGWMLLRTFLEHLLRPRKGNPKAYGTARKAAYTYLCILTLLLMLTGGIMAFVDAAPETIKTAMLWISATIYAVLLLRKTQILISSYSFFASFLYLCALEIIPTGALVASAIIF